MKKAILYVHGKVGSHLEAKQYKKNCFGFDMVGVEYHDYLPWVVQSQIRSVYDKVCERYDCIYLIANSIGAYFAMHTLQNCSIAKALFRAYSASKKPLNPEHFREKYGIIGAKEAHQ